MTKDISKDAKQKQLQLQRCNEEMKSLNQEMDIAVYATNRYMELQSRSFWGSRGSKDRFFCRHHAKTLKING